MGLLTHFNQGWEYVRQHPNIVLVLFLLLVLPLLFLYSNQQFLEAGRANQDRLQKDRVGLLHDAFASLLAATDFDPTIADRELRAVANQNGDIVNFIIAKRIGGEVIPIAALDAQIVGNPLADDTLFRDAALRLDESMIFEFSTVDGRQWYAYRAIESSSGQLYFVYTQLSMQAVDDLFAATTQKAMWSLVLVYVFIAGLAYWHVRMTDYRYLYSEVKKANETKDLFTNMIAHELRAPLTAIRGYASMMEESDTANKDYATRVRESSERLIALVNDLLDLARIQSGKLSIQTESVNVADVIKKVIAELSISSAEKSITLQYEGSTNLHFITADPKRLQQVLTNLVSNSIKYTREGKITIAVSESANAIEIRVKDTGMGIASEDQQKLFAPFFRVAGEDVSKITGTGLGMWITKQLTELMGGKIAVESIKGVGTHVVVTFPKAESASSK